MNYFDINFVLKVALITDTIWPLTLGGIQKHSYYLCKYLALTGIYVDVYYSGDAEDSGSRIADAFSETELVYLSFIFVPFPRRRFFPGHYLYELYLYSKEVYRVASRHFDKYDICYIQGLSGWYFLRTKRSEREPIRVLNLHGLNMFQPSLDIRTTLEIFLFKPIALKLLWNADYVQSLGGRLTDLLIKKKISRSKIIEIGIGIEEAWIDQSNSIDRDVRRGFAFVGRFDRIKGIKELNTALRRLVGRSDFDFHLVGPFPEKQKVNSPNIYYHGELGSEEEIRKVLDAVDFLVMPSYSEGMPTAILEAMARSCAIIATDVGAVNELVSSENGILIASHDEKLLLDAIVSGIEMDEEHLLAKQQYSLTTIKRDYLWPKVIGELVDYFNRIALKGV